MECFVAAGRSEIGNGRKLNEDSIELVEAFDGTYGIYILCDGMGGHKRGDLASELAVRYARRSILDKLNPTMEARELRALMYQALSNANQMVYQFAQRSFRFTGMGTTIVAGLLRDDGLLVYGHAGDSRLYGFTPQIERLTKDHSVAQAFIDQGLLREEDVATFPRRNEITRCIGMGPDMTPTIDVRSLEPGDRLLFCSDGLHGVCPDAVIQNVMDASQDPQENSEALIQTALDFHSRDNISCIVVNFHGNDA